MTPEEAIATLPTDRTAALTLLRPLNTAFRPQLNGAARVTTCPLAVHLQQLTGLHVSVWPNNGLGARAIIGSHIAPLPTGYGHIVSILDLEAGIAGNTLNDGPRNIPKLLERLNALLDDADLTPPSV